MISKFIKNKKQYIQSSECSKKKKQKAVPPNQANLLMMQRIIIEGTKSQMAYINETLLPNRTENTTVILI